MINIIIDGRQYQVEPNQSLLSAAEACGIEIPSLCGSDGLSGCCLCEVEVKNSGTVKACETSPAEGMSVITSSPALSRRRKQNLEDILSRPDINCAVPPCQQACPALVDIQSYLYFISRGDNAKAVDVIRKTLPMPLSIGRVCPAFCEAKCLRNQVDEPLAIRFLKRHAADKVLSGSHPLVPQPKPEKKKHIAIVGAGPGGLSCGYFLTNEGYAVTVFEAMPKAGGWLRYGIPEYRLPKAILDKEIDIMCTNGMKIELNQRLGSDFSLSALSQDYDAVCLAIGASQASEMNYPGSELPGCFLGVDFLKDQIMEKQFAVGKKVAVIGGGNTAIDCARTALRLGADTTLIYRRTREEMPAETYEIEEAEHEGVHFYFLTNPVENIADETGRVCQVKLEKMALGEPDASGRRRPRPTGEFFMDEFDTVIAAVSQKTDMSFIENENKLELPLTRWNTLTTDNDSMFTGVANIFGIGDFRRGPATAVEAIADGRRAAQGIDAFLGGDMEKLYTDSFHSRNVDRIHLVRAQHADKLKDVIRNRMGRQPDKEVEQALQKFFRARMPSLPLDECKHTFAEVELGLSGQAAMTEAQRCLSCGCMDGNACKLRRYATDYQVDKLKIQQHHP
ncbi:Glutamate synthase [NADPH] small chain [Vibrio aerogenes CECT 7868]|uniref:Glutamate synthase [NADPH] small chain n=1 Tax=Vibrio aerogenes CECT 7868 TaxID=1216006 RepID=A0A1M6DLE4_9VIBR|nr:FAD-dependent oxidoreductase [Vibrio aerogenes]SHI74147.1 Glutamate synthase [NADPH] small chain [Vibrio aerogenes CECT 7868]